MEPLWCYLFFFWSEPKSPSGVFVMVKHIYGHLYRAHVVIKYSRQLNFIPLRPIFLLVGLHFTLSNFKVQRSVKKKKKKGLGLKTFQLSTMRKYDFTHIIWLIVQ